MVANQIDYKPNANLLLNGQIERELVYGKGRAFGVEFQIKKTKGKLTGWFNYTLSRALRTLRISMQALSFRHDKIEFMTRSEEHTSELQSRPHLVCRLLLEKKK